MSYQGTIIEESLEDKAVLKDMRIVSTKVEQVTERHQTPWIKHWTLHAVEIPEEKAEETAKLLSKSLDSQHDWYADYRNETNHYIIFRNKVFFIDRRKADEYQQAREYGISLGIPEYQVNFSRQLIKDA